MSDQQPTTLGKSYLEVFWKTSIPKKCLKLPWKFPWKTAVCCMHVTLQKKDSATDILPRVFFAKRHSPEHLEWLFLWTKMSPQSLSCFFLSFFLSFFVSNVFLRDLIYQNTYWMNAASKLVMFFYLLFWFQLSFLKDGKHALSGFRGSLTKVFRKIIGILFIWNW